MLGCCGLHSNKQRFPTTAWLLTLHEHLTTYLHVLPACLTRTLRRITKPFTLLTIGILVAQAVSGPVAAGFLAMNGLGGLHGWQW